MAKRTPPVDAFAERTASRPKGPNPGKIPRSTPYIDPRTQRDNTRPASRAPQGRRTDDGADADERAAFTARELPPSPRNRVVSQAALASSRARMTGNFEGFDPSAQNAFNARDVMDDVDEPVDIQDDGSVEGQGFSRDDVESIVNEALRRDRLARGEGTTEPLPQPTRDDVAKVRVPNPMTTARTTDMPLVQQEPDHPAHAFLPPQHRQGKIGAATEAALPHGAFSHPSGLLAMPLRIADVDRLWDWLRQDGDQGATFLGMAITTSPMLHEHLSFLAKDAEQRGVALIRSLYWQGTHFGFAMLAPILADEATALMHVYLMKDARGSLHAILPALVSVAQQAAPGKHLAVASPDKVWAKLHRQLLGPLGFVEHTMFVL